MEMLFRGSFLSMVMLFGDFGLLHVMMPLLRLFDDLPMEVILATWTHMTSLISPISIIAKITGFSLLNPNHRNIIPLAGIHWTGYVFNVSGIGVVWVVDIATLTLCNWGVVTFWEALLVMRVDGLDLG
jgi:hypothetical protein